MGELGGVDESVVWPRIATSFLWPVASSMKGWQMFTVQNVLSNLYYFANN